MASEHICPLSSRLLKTGSRKNTAKNSQSSMAVKFHYGSIRWGGGLLYWRKNISFPIKYAKLEFCEIVLFSLNISGNVCRTKPWSPLDQMTILNLILKWQAYKQPDCQDQHSLAFFIFWHSFASPVELFWNVDAKKLNAHLQSISNCKNSTQITCVRYVINSKVISSILNL